jgi:copper chaperone CopZ
MIRAFVLVALFSGLIVSVVRADEPAAATKATFSITGLHCPPCSRTVESALGGVKGVRSAKVDWPTKTAKLEFDERAVSAQQIAATVAHTPHMMGSGMQYGSWLVLSVPDLKDDTTAKAAREALGPLSGVANVTPFVSQHQVSVQFDAKGSVTTAELIAALAKAGLSAKSY